MLDQDDLNQKMKPLSKTNIPFSILHASVIHIGASSVVKTYAHKRAFNLLEEKVVHSCVVLHFY